MHEDGLGDGHTLEVFALGDERAVDALPHLVGVEIGDAGAQEGLERAGRDVHGIGLAAGGVVGPDLERAAQFAHRLFTAHAGAGGHVLQRGGGSDDGEGEQVFAIGLRRLGEVGGQGEGEGRRHGDRKDVRVKDWKE